MLFSRTFSLLFLAVVAGCSSAPQLDSKREIASSEAAAQKEIAFPESHSFDLKNIKGQTYITFLKNELKPAMDMLSSKENGGGGGFDNVGSSRYMKGAAALDPLTWQKYKGAKWDRVRKTYTGDIPDANVIKIYDTLLAMKPKSNIDSLGYYDAKDRAWFEKNDMSVAIAEAGVKGDAFDLGTLYALTGGIGVKVKIDSQNVNYHVMYKTGKFNPSQQVMSGRSFATGPGRGAADATDPQYLDDLEEYLGETVDQKPFYRALILSIADSDPSVWKPLSELGQAVLSDFYTVYTAEAIRHLMVNLQYGKHPWEIDLAAVTYVSSISKVLGKVVQDGELVEADLGAWFAPSKNNAPGKPRRSGIGITRRDRKIFQAKIHEFEAKQVDGKKIIAAIHKIIGKKSSSDVIQAVFEYLSNPKTPASMGENAVQLADLMAQFNELAVEDAKEIEKLLL